jgi:hypothetical protein
MASEEDAMARRVKELDAKATETARLKSLRDAALKPKADSQDFEPAKAPTKIAGTN